MDQKHKEQLRYLLNARKRAEKVLAQRREAERKKQQHAQHVSANQERMRQDAQKLRALAEESGMLALAEQAAGQRGGTLKKEVGYYLDYGYSTSRLQHAVVALEQGEDMGHLQVAYLTLRVTWKIGDEAGTLNKAETRVHRNGMVTFHNCLLPVFPFIWRKFPHLLEKMFASALDHPRRLEPEEKAHH